MATKISLPARYCKLIAEEAALVARMLAPKKTGEGAKSIYPVWGDGEIGLRCGLQYMYYQNYGIRPFIMWNLEGKTIPMNIGGKTVFRVARGVGEHRINKRDPRTGQILRGNSPIKWRHPGLPPKNFLEEGLDRTLLKYHAKIAFIMKKMMVVEKLKKRGGKING